MPAEDQSTFWEKRVSVAEKNSQNILARVKELCSVRVVSPSPHDVADIRIRVEDSLLTLRLWVAKLNRQRSVDFNANFEALRWDGDDLRGYNEARISAGESVSHIDEYVAVFKAHINFIDKLGDILNALTTSHYRD